MKVTANPLLAALPPATDYLTYLTIVEYILHKDQLPTLHTLLQDTRLTTNIGWDLVHLLLPLLPESEQCLMDVARLGNPREVVLKVTEMLEFLGLAGNDTGDFSDSDNDVDETSDDDDESDAKIAPQASPSTSPLALELQLLKFQVLVRMLSILHPRIKTEYPSRFIMASLNSLLPVYRHLAQHPVATTAVLDFIKSVMSPPIRPPLPPRKSGGSIDSSESSKPVPAPDPEGLNEPISREEQELKPKLMISFLTHLFESFVDTIPLLEDNSGLAWTTMNLEPVQPEISHNARGCLHKAFETDDELKRRITSATSILNTADTVLPLSWQDAVKELRNPNGIETSALLAEDYPLSRRGLLYLLTARQYYHFFERDIIPLSTISGLHRDLVLEFLRGGLLDIDNEAQAAVVDSVLYLGWWILDEGSEHHPTFDSYQRFFEYMQQLTLTATHMPLTTLRYEAYRYASVILHSCPSSDFRFKFIVDTLQLAPFENLKECAVDWLKSEILDAFGLSPGPRWHDRVARYRPPERTMSETEDDSFADPINFATIACFLFQFPRPDEENSLEEMNSQAPYLIKLLNFLYLLCENKKLRKGLNMVNLNEKLDFKKMLLTPVSDLIGRSLDAGAAKEEDNANASKDGDNVHVFELRDKQLLQSALEKAWEALDNMQIVEKPEAE